MDAAIATIWIVTLAVIVLLTPLVLYLCWRLVRGAKNIEHHFEVTLKAATGVAAGTAAIPALQDTIGVAGGMLQTAGSIDQHSAAIVGLLASRLKEGA